MLDRVMKKGDLVHHKQYGVGIVLKETYGWDWDHSFYIVLFGAEEKEVDECDLTEVKKCP